ncbi:MAG: pyridoxamine 5'-phosphate oxidase family protein [Candidatus Cloacimonetes bacterium]|nr:pyridoxamine 5'-phosphate oxidase family protein [Candidatus Cloacimonadota bacterium]
MNKKKLNEFLNKSDLMYLATCSDGKPHVRCMAMIYFEDTIWCCSKSNRLKVQEIKQNDSIEICILIEGEKDIGSIRGNGKAIIITDPKIRKKLSKKIPFFKTYWESSEDDDFTLIKLEINEFMFHDPDDKQFYSILQNLVE